MIIEFQPILIPSLHLCMIAIATLIAFTPYQQVANNLPSSSHTTTPANPKPILTIYLASILIFIKPELGGVHRTILSVLGEIGSGLVTGRDVASLKDLAEWEITAITCLRLIGCWLN